MATINGVGAAAAQTAKPEPKANQEVEIKKTEEKVRVQKADDAVVSEVRSRPTEEIRDEKEAFALAGALSKKIADAGPSAVDSFGAQPDQVQELLS